MSSLRKREANKTNADKSTGPTTERGKRNSSASAVKHGFYSRELRVSESDMPDFEMCRQALQAQLARSTPLQDIAVERIVACCWINKLALRLQMHQLKRHLPADDESTAQKTDLQRDPREIQWYLASPQDLRYGRQIIQEMFDDVSQNGLAHIETWKDKLSKPFPGLYELVTEWQGMSIDAIMVAENLVAHSRLYKRPLPSLPPEATRIAADPKQKQQMVVKLVGLQLRHLSDLLFVSSQASPMRETAANEFAPRYFANSSRDLQRAVEWYLHLRANNL